MTLKLTEGISSGWPV